MSSSRAATIRRQPRRARPRRSRRGAASSPFPSYSIARRRRCLRAFAGNSGASGSPGLAPAIAIDEVRDDALLAAVDRGVERAIVRIVLLRLAERVDRVLMVALRLQRLAQASPCVRIAEVDLGPRAAKLGRPAPVARLQHSRPFDLQ